MTYWNDTAEQDGAVLLRADGSDDKNRCDDDGGLFSAFDDRKRGGSGGTGPGGGHRPPSRTGWLYFLIVCLLVAYAFMSMGGMFRGMEASTEIPHQRLRDRGGRRARREGNV